jgi:lysozyme
MAQVLPDTELNWPLPYEAVVFIAVREGCRLKAYLCPAGKWTCGWGETDGVTSTTEWTQDFADQRFCDSLTERTNAVLAACTRTPTPAQLGAMVSLTYNIGIEGFKSSTVLRQHNAGNTTAAARAFTLWNKITDPATGKKVESKGLTARRLAESVMYSDDEDVRAEMPQQVVGESKLADSPIAKSGVATVAAGALTLLKDQADTANGVVAALSQIASNLHVAPSTLLGGALLIAGAVCIYQRWQQRRGGWA